jgi:hypothetical protein
MQCISTVFNEFYVGKFLSKFTGHIKTNGKNISHYSQFSGLLDSLLFYQFHLTMTKRHLNSGFPDSQLPRGGFLGQEFLFSKEL